MSIAQLMREQMAGGGAFTPADFDVDPTLAAQMLSRFSRQGWLAKRGKGVYTRGEVSDQDVVRTILRKIGEPRFLPARDAALKALGVLSGRDYAVVTTNGAIHRLAATMPTGWRLVRRNPSRRACSEGGNLVLEALRWMPAPDVEVASKLQELLSSEVILADLAPALPMERTGVVKVLRKLAGQAGWPTEDLSELDSYSQRPRSRFSK